MANNTYNSPFNARYASKEMQYIFSPDFNLKLGENFGLHLQSQKKNSVLILHKNK